MKPLELIEDYLTIRGRDKETANLVFEPGDAE